LKALRTPALIVAMAALLLATATATAQAQVTIGQLAPSGTPVSECEYSDPYDEVQTAVASGNGYTVPVSGVLTSWSTNAGLGPNQQLGLKVFRRTGLNTFLVVASDPRPIASNVLNTFPVSIPVQAGDLIGLHIPAETTAPTACVFETGDARDEIHFQEGDATPGSTISTKSFSEYRLNVSATILPPPVAAGLSLTAGSIAGGAQVAIAGVNFASVTGVSFGSTPVAFTVPSEGQIVATAPPSATLGAVPVTVTTAAGIATAPQTFTYEGCQVPKLGGKKLKASKKKLRKADCKVGNIKKRGDATAKTGKVVKQNPKAGAILLPGAKVKVTLAE
jgi:hypothetical protein